MSRFQRTIWTGIQVDENGMESKCRYGEKRPPVDIFAKGER